MRRFPRLALATAPGGPGPSPSALAMVAGLTSHGWRVQHFRSQAQPSGTVWVGQATGLPERHLDAWLMSPEVCRDVFLRGVRQADLAVVEGAIGPDVRAGGVFASSTLEPLIGVLGLPTVAVVPCQGLDDLHLPSLPPHVAAVLLDGLKRPGDYDTLSQMVALLLRRPVIGAVEELPEVRRALEAAGPDRPLPEDVIGRLALSFLRFVDLRTIRELAESRPLPWPGEAHGPRPARRFRVAYAHDEAFGGYFPDTLEMLEGLGAELVEFSPLRSESLPDGVDLVMIGCGFPDLHAEALASNLSMIASLKHHVCRGLRIYSEGGGTAYLARYMVLGHRRIPGAGILPVDAVHRPGPCMPIPVVRRLNRSSWLGPAGTEVRGYRSPRWSLTEAPDPGDCPTRSGALAPEGDLVFRHHAIGSLIHLHLASLPDVVSGFIGPHRPSLSLPQRAPLGTPPPRPS
jgi:cobyrinic acid a,c-diamide synthase